MNCGAIRPRPLRVVIGIGNSLRGDDGAGPAVIQRLNLMRGGPSDHERLISRHQLVPELAVDLAQTSLVIFIDASPALNAGDLRCQRVPARRQAALLGHQLTPADLLQLTLQAFGRCPRGWLYTIGGRQWELGEDLSDPVAKAVVQLAARFRRRGGTLRSILS